MRLVDPSRTAMGGAIIVAHALVLYGLASVAPQARQVAVQAAVVHFIDPPQAQRDWTPPTVRVAPPPLDVQTPSLAPIDAPTTPASERAISAPQHIASLDAAHEERSAPKLISAVEYVREPSPRYPLQSRRLREEGVVVLRVVIDERGHACDIVVETSSGHERLDRAAREAVAIAAFRPYVENGEPRRAQVLIPIEFFLNRRSA